MDSSNGRRIADVVDGPDGDDFTLRPNQIFAVSLPFLLLEGSEAARVVDAVGRTLLTSYGLRSLSPDNPAYHGDYGGDREAALALLQPFEDHLRAAGLGTISEILAGDPPHLPNGCIAQAWGVAEVLRVWRELER